MATFGGGQRVESDDEDTFHLGEGRAQVQLEMAVTYFKRFRYWQKEETPIMQQAIQVLYIEGSTALSERKLLGAYAHDSYSDPSHQQREATSRVKRDIASGLIEGLKRKAAQLGASPLIAPVHFDTRLKAFARRYRHIVSAIIHAGIYSDRFGVNFYEERRILRIVYYSYLRDYFTPLLYRQIVEQMSWQRDAWYLFSLERQLQVYEERVFGVTSVDPLEKILLRTLPWRAIPLAVYNVERVLRVFFGIYTEVDPDNTQYVFCWFGNY